MRRLSILIISLVIALGNIHTVPMVAMADDSHMPHCDMCVERNLPLDECDTATGNSQLKSQAPLAQTHDCDCDFEGVDEGHEGGVFSPAPRPPKGKILATVPRMKCLQRGGAAILDPVSTVQENRGYLRALQAVKQLK